MQPRQHRAFAAEPGPLANHPIVDIITAAIIYFAAFALIFKGFINNRRSRRLNYSVEEESPPQPAESPPLDPDAGGGERS